MLFSELYLSFPNYFVISIFENCSFSLALIVQLIHIYMCMFSYGEINRFG